jgi:protein SCO1
MPARVRLALIVAATLAIATAAGFILLGDPAGDDAGGRAGGFAGALRPDIPPRDFALRDQDGELVSLRALRGRVVVLTFLYTTCKDTCPTTAAQIRGALDDLGGDVPALAVSVDPPNDTADRAEAFLLKRGLSGGRMRFLLGDRARLEPVWKAYGVRPQGEGFEHSASTVLIDKRGRQRVGFPTDQLTPAGLAHDVRRLQAEA